MLRTSTTIHRQLYIKPEMKLLVLVCSAACLLFVSGMIAAQTESQKPLVPDLKFTTTGGKDWSLHNSRGRVLALNFWATWCQPCRTEIPYLVKIAEEYKERGVSVVGVSLDEVGNPLIAKFSAEYKISYPIVFPAPGSPFSKLENLPITLVIDREGRLAEKYTGAVPEKTLRADLEKLLDSAKPGSTR
jgi:thiol-disulfide isomerase/thioredoxin